MGFPQPDTGAVTEDTGVVGGFISASGDADFGPFINNDAGQWTAQTLAGAYGSQLVIDTDGVWTYTADNANATIQALDTGDTLTEVFTITSTQGTTTVTITINGLDEPPCFATGTLIETPHGPRPVETLGAGDAVLTRDDGVQHIRWAGCREMVLADSPTDTGFQPIRLRAHSLGPGVPSRDMLVSPMHRLLIRGPAVSLLTGEAEILCAAQHLINGHSITRDPVSRVRYHHLLFDSHQVLTAHGCASESFYPGEVGLNGFGEATRDEILTLFPQLRSLLGSYGPIARAEVRKFEAALLRDDLCAATHRAKARCWHEAASSAA